MQEFKTQKKSGRDLIRISVFYHALFKGVHTKCEKQFTITISRARLITQEKKNKLTLIPLRIGIYLTTVYF